jgi:hypothetical protein
MSGKYAILAKNDDDVVVVAAYRTAITKASSLTNCHVHFVDLETKG